MNFRERLERSGELLAAKDKKYSPKCFIGNWSGERLEQDVSIKYEGKLSFGNISALVAQKKVFLRSKLLIMQ